MTNVGKGCSWSIGIVVGGFLLFLLLIDFLPSTNAGTTQPSARSSVDATSPYGEWIPDQDYYSGSTYWTSIVVRHDKTVSVTTSYWTNSGRKDSTGRSSAVWSDLPSEGLRIRPSNWLGARHLRFVDGRLFLYDLDEQLYELTRRP